MQSLILPKEKFNVFIETTKCKLVCLGIETERCTMKDYQKGLTLRDIQGTVMQHSDTNLLKTVNPRAKGQKQFPAQREQLLPAPV